jgi:hypothetical protein
LIHSLKIAGDASLGEGLAILFTRLRTGHHVVYFDKLFLGFGIFLSFLFAIADSAAVGRLD